jgi:hypothetical protein
MMKGSHKRILRRVLRISVRPQHGSRRTIHRRPTPVDELPERGGVAPPAPFNELAVGHTISRHITMADGWVLLGATVNG